MSKPRSFFRVFTETGPLIALAVAVGAVGRDRGAGLGAVLQFRRAAAAAAAAAQRRHWRRLVRRRPVRAVPAAAGAEARRKLFQGAAAGEARNRAGPQCARARRRHGGLARLWPGGCLCRSARHGRDPQAQDRLRPDQISAQGRSGRLGRRGERHPRHGKARRHRRHARTRRPPADAGAGGR